MKYKTMTIAGVFVCLTMFGAAIGRAQSYTITDLGSLNPTGINAWAQVVGNNNNHAFLWTRWTGSTDLGLLPGGTFSMAASINDLGVVVGTADGAGTVTFPDPSDNQQCSALTQPFVWKPRTGMKGLGTVAFYNSFPWSYYPCDLPYYGTGSNVAGQVVGYMGYFATYQFGFVWTNGPGMVPLGDSDGPTSADAVNSTGVIVGQNQFQYVAQWGHAVSWKQGVMQDLGTLSGADPQYDFGSSATDVNDFGQMVGWSQTPDAYHAVLWTPGAVISDLGTLPGDTFSAATKINFLGQVIGTSGTTLTIYAAYQSQGLNSFAISGRPFIWSQRRGMQDLNTLIRSNSGWVLNSVSDINLWGQIVGSGTYKGQTHGFLLTPTSFDNFVVQRPLRGLTHEAALNR